MMYNKLTSGLITLVSTLLSFNVGPLPPWEDIVVCKYLRWVWLACVNQCQDAFDHLSGACVEGEEKQSKQECDPHFTGCDACLVCFYVRALLTCCAKL